MTTGGLTSITDYGALVSELSRLAARSNQPAFGAFELTARCNLSCRMCYVRQSAACDAERELPAAAWLELARQAVDSGMVFLLLTGGEVFLRPDFFELYAPLTRMGLMLTLFTNATLVTESVAARLAEAPPSRTEVTLYGATAATYEAVTGVPGGFAACMAGIERLVKRGIPLGLKCTVTRGNAGELDDMRRMAHAWGLPFSAGWLLTKRRDGARSAVTDCRLSAADCVALEATDRASVEELTEAVRCESLSSPDDNFYCLAGRTSFAVNPQGEMNICLDLPLPGAPVLDEGFRAAWEELRRFVDNAAPPSAACRSCDIRAFCPRCPAWSYLENGTFTEPVPYLCEIAGARKERHGRPA